MFTASSNVSGRLVFLVSGRRRDNNPATVPIHPNITSGKAVPKLESMRTPYKSSNYYNDRFIK